MSLTLTLHPPRRLLARSGAVILSILLLIWTLLPVYNMALIALSEDGDEFSGQIWPEDWNWDSFRAIWQQDAGYFANFWREFGNSLLLGVATMALTVVIGSLAAFALGRMRLRRAWMITDMALLTYVVPAALLVIPFAHLMRLYGLADNLWAVVAAEVTLATPYAILILHQYGKLIPLELDEAATVDGASPGQVYLRIYLPLMAPALVAIGVYALLLAWNEYLYQFLLLSSPENSTVVLAINQFFITDEAPWNYMMAVALVYSVPPIAIYFALRRFMVAGLTLGGIK